MSCSECSVGRLADNGGLRDSSEARGLVVGTEGSTKTDGSRVGRCRVGPRREAGGCLPLPSRLARISQKLFGFGPNGRSISRSLSNSRNLEGGAEDLGCFSCCVEAGAPSLHFCCCFSGCDAFGRPRLDGFTLGKVPLTSPVDTTARRFRAGASSSSEDSTSITSMISWAVVTTHAPLGTPTLCGASSIASVGGEWGG